jgi:hypothetical protein
MKLQQGVTMKHLLNPAIALGAALLLAGPVQAADVDVGVSIQISKPGVYGRIDIGQFPQPQVVVAQPVIINRPPPNLGPRQPVYLWVPPGHRKNWRKHCREYQACGVPVLFVDDRWYDDHVHPRGKGKNKDKGHGHGHGKDKGKD